MNDRELLELAAKAAGYDYASPAGYIVVDGIPGNWNPLDDDGDALRLAVKCRIDVVWSSCGRVVAYWHAGNGDYPYHCMESSREDELGGARRAIVRAAAEIGRAMLTTHDGENRN